MAVLEEEYGHIRDEILYNLDMEDGATRDLLALYFDADTTSAELAAFYKNITLKNCLTSVYGCWFDCLSRCIMKVYLRNCCPV